MATSVAKEIDKGCYTCIKAALNYKPLYQVIDADVSSKTYGELLKELLQVDYISSAEESLPQKICGKCASLLKKMYIFILEARKRHEELMQISGITIQNCLQEIPIDMPQLNKMQIKTDPEIIETKHSLLELVDVQIKTELGDAEMQFSLSKNRNGGADTHDLNRNNGNKKEQQIVSDYRLDSISNDDSDVCSLAEDVVKEDLKLPQASLAVRCDICDKVYDNAVALKIHKTYTHMPEEQKMPCALCSYKSSRPSAIKVHLKNMHGPETVDKYFRPRRVLKGSLCCSQCPKRYSRKDHLQKHFKKAHLAVDNSVKKSNRKPKQRSDQIYLCTFCGQSFAENGTLSKHIRIHTGDKPFKCNFCEKSFRNSGNLKYHLTTHSDEKPHTCSECGKSFKRKDKLRSHMLVHSELRPYKCSECGKTFKYSCVLKTHMQIHNNQIQLTCRTCGESFSLRSSLNTHCAKSGHLQQ
uniref:Protein krueppel n=1 Tax=Glossina palpalis gambiensis TaxID=67801 RepID=A0A1B0BP23_9MUSC